MTRLAGKVAVITGVARGQGRSHATTLAREGADIFGFDLCAGHAFATADPSTEADLRETVRLVEDLDRRCIARKADARDLTTMQDLAELAIAEFGHVDILVINHGVWSNAPNAWEYEEGAWNESIDTMLTGAWKVAKAFVPKILASGRGGAIVLTGSVNATNSQPGGAGYNAAKHGLVALMRTLAKELGRYSVRVNMVNPGGVDTPMIHTGETTANALEWYPEYFGTSRYLLPVEIQPPQSISDAALWLVSDESAYVTGIMVPVDAGWMAN
jgi:SDR family mycofactocin-dependent oxidoreductase